LLAKEGSVKRNLFKHAAPGRPVVRGCAGSTAATQSAAAARMNAISAVALAFGVQGPTPGAAQQQPAAQQLATRQQQRSSSALVRAHVFVEVSLLLGMWCQGCQATRCLLFASRALRCAAQLWGGNVMEPGQPASLPLSV
jgi:hypothetical protein